ncbi:MAG: hypothetical protein AABX85_03725 [Nanoarchaeota archaeon]
MKEKLFIYGAGDNGVRLALDMQDGKKLKNYHFSGFVDDSKSGLVVGFKVLGAWDVCEELLDRGINNAVVSLLGDPVKRLSKCLELEKMGFNFPSVYSYENVPRTVEKGNGIFIHETSVFLGYDQKIGDYVVIGPNTTIQGRTSIGRGSIVCPHSFLGYNSLVGEACLLGVRSTVLPNLTLGNRVVVGPHVLQHRNLGDDEKSIRPY